MILQVTGGTSPFFRHFRVHTCLMGTVWCYQTWLENPLCTIFMGTSCINWLFSITMFHYQRVSWFPSSYMFDLRWISTKLDGVIKPANTTANPSCKRYIVKPYEVTKTTGNTQAAKEIFSPKVLLVQKWSVCPQRPAINFSDFATRISDTHIKKQVGLYSI